MAGAAESTARIMTRSNAAAPVTRCACIDVGSNTTRLLVAEPDGGRLREVVSERAFTLLGAPEGTPYAVGEDKIGEVAQVVARQVRVAEALGVVSLRVVATAAVRGADDRAAVADAIAAACGARLEILDTGEEARLAFQGAIGMLPTCPGGLLGVVDVGGGSTELVVGTRRDGVTWSVSLPVGSSSLTHRESLSDPPTTAELARVREKLAASFAVADAPQPAVAYAVGGSATSMQRLMGPSLD